MRQRQVIVVCLLALGTSLVPSVAVAGRQVSQPATRPAGQPRSKMADLPIETLAHTTISSGRSASRDVLNDNGGWCWFQDERAIFTTDGRLLVSSVAVSPGTGSNTRSGSVEITNRELATGRTWVDTLYRGVTGDDHNAAALVELPNKRIEAVFADHSRSPLIHPTHIDPRLEFDSRSSGLPTGGRCHRPRHWVGPQVGCHVLESRVPRRRERRSRPAV